MSRPVSTAPAWFAVLVWLFIVALNVAWFGFIGWAAYTLITWLVTK